MPNEPLTQGPDITALEDAVRGNLRSLNRTRDTAAAAADAKIEQMSAATETAGDSYNDAIAGAQTTFDQSLVEYAQQLATGQQNLDSAKDHLGEVAEYEDQETAIHSIAAPTPVTVPAGGDPDVTAANVEVAVNALQAQLDQMRTDLVIVLLHFNAFLISGNQGHLVAAAQKLTDYAQDMHNSLPTAEDVEAEKSLALDALQGLLP